MKKKRVFSTIAATLLVPAAFAQSQSPATETSARSTPKRTSAPVTPRKPVKKEASSLVDRVETTGFVAVPADSFNTLAPNEKALAYWLSQASIAVDPIIYDQLSRFGLRQKYLLELIVAHPAGIDPAVHKKIENYTKLFWASHGNHNDTTAQKFLPEFTAEELKKAAAQALATAHPSMTAAQLQTELQELQPSFFDPTFEPQLTAKNPRGGLDIIQGSANNFYGPGVTLADLGKLKEEHPLNSRVVKNADGTLGEEVYRAGTPDGSIKPGRYAEFLGKAVTYLQKARPLAESDQQAVIDALIRYYQTGDYQDWLKFGILWVQNNPKVDFANGFIEVYRDARGAKGTSQSFVSVTDERLNKLMLKIADNAQYFENHAPWADQYKKQGVKPPLAKAIETVIETGDFGVTTVGDNLPNENEIREKYGTKSFLFTGSTRALNHARGTSMIDEFAWDAQDREITLKYGDEAEDLLTALHEIIGHGSGKVSPKLTQDPSTYLKEYYSTLEEARADLMALWNIGDPRLQELGLVSHPDVAKAMYYGQFRAPLVQLRSIPHGDSIEEDHQRDRQLIAFYIMENVPGSIEFAKRDGKTYVHIIDFEKARKGVGMLLAELMRIKGEGDYDAIKALIDKYGVHFDPKLRDEVIARYQKLDIPTYWAGVHAELRPHLSASGDLTSVILGVPASVTSQRLQWAAMYHPELGQTSVTVQRQ